MFFSMLFFTACHVGVRLLGVALLAVVSPLTTAAVLGGDMLFYLLFKLARNDLRYWLKLDGGLSLVVSIVVRFFFKLMVDFTVMVQLRHPGEIGGLYWVVCLILGQTTSFVAVYLYTTILGSEGSSKSSHDLWALLGATEAGFVFFFTIFVGAMAAKYRVTFFSTITAKKFTHDFFRNATSDGVKIGIFNCHPAYYAGIRDEVKAWVSDNYSTWNEEQPDWFTERVKASIPKGMIPESEEVEQTSVSERRSKLRASASSRKTGSQSAREFERRQCQ